MFAASVSFDSRRAIRPSTEVYLDGDTSQQEQTPAAWHETKHLATGGAHITKIYHSRQYFLSIQDSLGQAKQAMVSAGSNVAVGQYKQRFTGIGEMTRRISVLS